MTTITPAAATGDGKSQMTLSSSYDSQIFKSSLSHNMEFESLRSNASECTDSSPDGDSKMIFPKSSPTFSFILSNNVVDNHQHLEQAEPDDGGEATKLSSYVVVD